MLGLNLWGRTSSVQERQRMCLGHCRDMSVPVLSWCQPPGKPGTGLTSLGEIQCPSGPFQVCPGLCSLRGLAVLLVPGTSYLGNVRNALCWGFFLLCEPNPSVPGTETPHPACSASCRHCCPGWLPAGAGLEHPWGSWSITPAQQGYGVPSSKGAWGPGTGSRLQGARPGDAGCRGASWWMFGGEPGTGLEHRHVFLSPATAPCASEGASSALEQNPARHKWLLEPLRCLGKWLQIALTAGELCWGISPLQHTQHPSPL